MGLKTALDIAITDGFLRLDEMEVASDDYTKTAKILNELSDRRIKIYELEQKDEDQKFIRETDRELRLQQMKRDQLDRYIKHGLTAVSVLGGFALTFWGAKASWRFEETGTITSTAGRKFINNLFFKK